MYLCVSGCINFHIYINMAVHIAIANQLKFGSYDARTESEILAEIEGLNSEDIMKYLDEELKRHDEVCPRFLWNYHQILERIWSLNDSEPQT